MIKVYVKDLIDMLKIKGDQLNIIVCKALIAAMINKKIAYKDRQMIIIDENVFKTLWNIYLSSLCYFDINYNRKTDFKLYFEYIIDSLMNNKQLTFLSLFCPGYTKDGYKDRLGNTTKWKLAELKNINSFFQENEVDNLIYCYYSDVFLENTDYEVNSKWMIQMDYNRYLFHEEAKKYFDEIYVKNASDLEIFSEEKSISGYIDDNLVKKVNPRTYKSFKKNKKKFYNKLGFSKEQMLFRNDRLITMYKLLSDYINSQSNTIFLPMENMYERENIFSENNTCTMYLKLKRR